MALSFSIARIPYTAVISIIMPHNMFEAISGICKPKVSAMKLVNASPQISLVIPNQPMRLIANTTLTRYLAPFLPKEDSESVQEAMPRSDP